MDIKNFFKKIIKYDENNEYNFSISNNFEVKQPEPKEVERKVSTNITENLDYLKSKYNTLLNNDVIIREFSMYALNQNYSCFLIYIDGLSDAISINDFILRPLMLRQYKHNDNIKMDLSTYIDNCLIPQNSVKKVQDFSDVFSGINMGDCLVFIDTLNIAFDIDIKGFQTRSISKPENEVVIRGPQEAFVENIRTNTTLIRRIINNENLIIENIKIGKISQTNCAICYIKNITNNDLVAEAKYRLNNIDIDYLISSGQLEQLIEDNSKYSIPQIISTERPDKAGRYLLEGRIAIIVNGSPYALVLPATFIDFLDSPEDKNIKFQFANLLKVVRVFSFLITLLLPGIYVAITSFHQEFIPTELLFAIVASRASVPFSIIFEIIIMELSFELIREASLRVPTPIGPTIGVIRRINYRPSCC